MLISNEFFLLLPLHPERRISQHVVESHYGTTVMLESASQLDIIFVLLLDQHVRLIRGKGFDHLVPFPNPEPVSTSPIPVMRAVKSASFWEAEVAIR